MLTDEANTDSAPGPGRLRLRRPFESALSLGLSARYVSSAVTIALTTAASFAAVCISLAAATSGGTAVLLD